MTNGNSPKIASEIIDAILAYGDARADKDLVKGTASLKKSIELIRSALSVCADGGKDEAVAYISGADEYGPKLLWKKHWVDLIGQSLYTAPQAECAPSADAEKDAALTDDDLGELWNVARYQGSWDSFVKTAREILAAKEPK